MYNCEKCIHEELCDQPGRQLWGHLTKETDCSDFKDRQNYVEVVRCKDCKHMVTTPNGLRLCSVWCDINGMGDEGFCNYGERREGE